MQNWELTAFVSHNTGTQMPGRSVSSLWKKKNEKGKTDFERMKELSAEGCELVSTTPINSKGTTYDLMFIFKRPIEETEGQ